MKRGDVLLSDSNLWENVQNIVGYLGPAEKILLADEDGVCAADLVAGSTEKIHYLVHSPGVTKVKTKGNIEENTIRLIFRISK